MEIQKIFKDFNNLKALIVGDVMIDAYYLGKVDRISPEAPVPVVALTKKENRMGGAANVALNIKSLGASPLLCSVIGNDADAQIFKHLLNENGLDDSGIVSSTERQTTVKTRVIGNNHQMLRIDQEITDLLNPEEEDQLLEKVANLLPQADVLIFSDYDKGVLTPKVIEQIIALCKQQNIPTVADPKKRNFLAYNGVSLFKPNLKELADGLKTMPIKPESDTISNAIIQLQQQMPHQISMITLSEHGVYYSVNDQKSIIPAHLRTIADVSGAGDTVISVASLCLALNLPAERIVQLSNLAGGLVCEYLGVVPIKKEQLLEEAIQHHL
ncbi:MAG: bifunctional ADP-heptose synthase [Bacteroidota bacterium]|nr:bifunctional ADP-heptose synthase [Bacteroidota bacterium]